MPEHAPQKVVLDVMGADGGPEPIIQGGIDAARSRPDSLHMILVGREDSIKPVLADIDQVPSNISVQHAETAIPMHVPATEGVRQRDSSMAVGLTMIRQGKADAFVSAGNTGAVMATSLLTLGRIKGVSRPAIAGQFPTSGERPCIVLDVGANADCKPIHLSQFAVMGSVFYQIAYDCAAPRVGLLSIGEERSKGNDLIFSARKLLGDSLINFVGNIEGRDILSGAIDVAVTDGFTGNIILKFGESIKPFLVSKVQHQIQTNIFSRIGATLLIPFFRRMRNAFDYAHTGGAPLLGVNGVVIISHGHSNARAITNAIGVAYNMAAKKFIDCIRRELIHNHFGTNDESPNQSQDLRDGVVCPTGSDD
jgi:glycerol-3-phosphate acyltransferase PlsX